MKAVMFLAGCLVLVFALDVILTRLFGRWGG